MTRNIANMPRPAVTPVSACLPPGRRFKRFNVLKHRYFARLFRIRRRPARAPAQAGAALISQSIRSYAEVFTKLPIVTVVLNNAKLGFIRLELEAKGLPDWGTDLTNPDFATVAVACGGWGRKVTTPDEMGPALREALAQDGPALLDVMVDPDALIMPPKIGLSQAVNFGLAKVREAFGA